MVRRVVPVLLFLAGAVAAAVAAPGTEGSQAWTDGAGTTNVHWSFQPIKRPTVPSHGRSKGGNPIDAFIQSVLDANNLAASKIADRRTLARRLYVDLIGLAPTPEEAGAFENDHAADAYERLVDTLLASPRYGERWARHWLDVVRFAETTGFEVNTPRPNAWPYRDYVVRAFNEDLPYDRFIREQIAGDALGEDVATGFLVAGPDDQVKSPDPILTSNQRADELHDIVSTTASAFLGLTVGCARCHNHKFDPIPQTEYYAVRAVFEGVRHGERKMRTPDSEARETELAERRRRLDEIDARLVLFEPLAQVEQIDTNALRAPVNARQNVERFAEVMARRVRFSVRQTTDAEPCIDELEVYAAGLAPRNIALATAGTKTRASSVFPNSDFHRLEHLNDGRYGNGRSWISNERGKGWVELEFPEVFRINRIVWGRDREQKYSDRLATAYEIEVAAGSNDWHRVASSLDRHSFQRDRKGEPAVSVAGLTPEKAAEAKALAAERKEQEARIAVLSRAAVVYAGTFADSPPATHRLHRGDPMQPREVVAPGALAAVPVAFSLPRTNAGAGEARRLTENQRRRLAFADWITDRANPLTARVMVNRLWQHHFGEGLVSTPSDFGKNGAQPSHPELLDWLASEFMDPQCGDAKLSQPGAGAAHKAPGGWSIKHLQRLIVTSATYRQASDPQPDAFARDAGNRLLWRFAPQRMEAEVIRDTILSVSGRLDLRMGGPGFSFFEPNDNYVRVYTPREEFGAETFRRMIYGTVVRQRPDGVFGVFDCPDAGQIAPKRTRSTTPLQALNLLNSAFMLQQSQLFAERLKREAGLDEGAQVRRAFALAFQREPDRQEVGASQEIIQGGGLAMFCRALLNANEFIHVY